MDIMDSGDVSIYLVTGGDYKMCRLMAKTPGSTRALPHSIPLKDLPGLAESVERDEIFRNRELAAELPVMAAPVFSAGKLVCVVMLWDIAFENLTLTTANRFAVLSKLISSVLEKAYAHVERVPESFMDIVNAYKQAKDVAGYQTILVHGSSQKLKSLLRENDHIGEIPGSDSAYALLSNTTAEGLPAVLGRLAESGITAEGVEL
jgi:hypothetical protein